MKLEFLPAGSPDCPLLRVFDFSAAEVRSLHQLCLDLREGRAAEVSLLDLQGILAIDGCALTFHCTDIDRGCERVAANDFECSLTPETWQDLAAMITPFCELQKTAGYQWLSEHGEISLLLSANGQW